MTTDDIIRKCEIKFSTFRVLEQDAEQLRLTIGQWEFLAFADMQVALQRADDGKFRWSKASGELEWFLWGATSKDSTGGTNPADVVKTP
jgi:hypothetical protein